MFDPRVTKWARIALSDPGYFTDVLRRKSRKALALDRRFGGGRSFGPSGIVITLTWRCNLRCQMCDQYGDDYKQPLSKLTRDDELELSEWKRVVDETVKYRCEYNLFGGEPLLFNGAVDLIRHIKGKGRRCSITTNGTLLDRYGEDIVTSGLDAMGVSVDGPPDVHDEIRGSDGSFERISQGIRQVKAWREKHGTRTPRININSVVTLWNHDRMLEMVELARELGVDGLTFQHLNFLEPRTMHSHMDYFRKRFQYDWPTREKDLGFLDTSGFDADVIHDQVTKIRKMDGLPISFLPDLTTREEINGYYHDIDFKFQESSCINPWIHVTINPKGVVTPCMEYPVGNVRDDDFATIWNGETFRTFRSELKKQGLFPGYCQRCCHRRFKSSKGAIAAHYL
jgi:Fe-coproporphyrin III synthase